MKKTFAVGLLLIAARAVGRPGRWIARRAVEPGRRGLREGQRAGAADPSVRAADVHLAPEPVLELRSAAVVSAHRRGRGAADRHRSDGRPGADAAGDGGNGPGAQQGRGEDSDAGPAYARASRSSCRRRAVRGAAGSQSRAGRGRRLAHGAQPAANGRKASRASRSADARSKSSQHPAINRLT